jgi:mono/diheme cytochrome c family protein
LGALAAFTLTVATPALAQQNLPEGAGRALLTTACTQCHGLGTIVSIRDGEGGWKHQVENMVLRGAQLTGPEVDTLVQYLAANFGPGSQRPPDPQAAAVTLPQGTGRDVLQSHCSLCHDLNRIVAIKRRTAEWNGIVANMVGRGAPVSAEDARAILGYLTANFASD